MSEETGTKAGIRVFVYGTLKRNFGNHYLLKDGNAEFLGFAAVRGRHKMVDLGYYPGLVEDPASPETTVFGEVYRVDRDTLNALDLLEGHPDYYRRTKIATPWKGAWCYYLPPEYLKRARWVEESNGVQIWRPTEEELRHVAAA